MRLGKEEAKGFIEEPAELSAAPGDPVEADPREEERTAALQRSPSNATEDQPAPTRGGGCGG
jgi:hypothetical protein